MSENRLTITVEATHESLRQRLRAATRPLSRTRLTDKHVGPDAFMAATSRHLAAVDEVLVPVAAKRLSDGQARVHAYLHQARLLEMAMVRLKARAYGEQHAAFVPWAQVWEDVGRELDRHNAMERELIDDLVEVLGDAEAGDLADRVYRAEVKAPTRAHPYIPHTGLAGRLARRIWALADRFWDTAEGRVLPMPVRPPAKEHAADSLMAQYLLGDPHFDKDATVFTHHKHRR